MKLVIYSCPHWSNEIKIKVFDYLIRNVEKFWLNLTVRLGVPSGHSNREQHCMSAYALSLQNLEQKQKQMDLVQKKGFRGFLSCVHSLPIYPQIKQIDHVEWKSRFRRA